MLYRAIRKLSFCLPPELAHRCALEGLRLAKAIRWPLPGGPISADCAIECLGLKFSNPVGLAAGFDKSAQYIDTLGAVGFAFIEVGTLTPHGQDGNPRPRIFRLPRSEALINRMGSPNRGIPYAVIRIQQRAYTGILGVNIGKNADTGLAEAVDDYVAGYRAVAAYADYVALNVSSPNTRGLRDLQGESYLKDILSAVAAARDSTVKRTPALVKLSPDLTPAALDSAAAAIVESGLDGVIATNTTTSRQGLPIDNSHAISGGLSGPPLHAKSLTSIRALRALLGPEPAIIGSGGIVDAQTAMETLAAGANLVQIYTGFVYRGPALIADIVRCWNARNAASEEASPSLAESTCGTGR